METDARSSRLRRIAGGGHEALSTAADVVERLARGTRSCLVLGVDGLSGAQLSHSLMAASTSGTAVVLRITHTPEAMQQLNEIIQHARYSRVSIHGFDDLLRDIAAPIPRAGIRQALPLVLDALCDLLSHDPKSAAVLLAAALIGWRRRFSDELIALTGMSRETMNRRLRESGFVASGALLAIVRCVYAAFLLDTSELGIPRAAAVCGHGSRSAFDEYLKAHSGRSPAEIKSHHEFLEVLGELPGRLMRRADPNSD